MRKRLCPILLTALIGVALPLVGYAQTAADFLFSTQETQAFDERIRDAATKTVEHGGEIVQDVHSIGPHGFRAIVLDSEGNRMVLHSESDA